MLYLKLSNQDFVDEKNKHQTPNHKPNCHPSSGLCHVTRLVFLLLVWFVRGICDWWTTKQGSFMIPVHYLCSCRRLLWNAQLTAQINTYKRALSANNSGKLKNPPKSKKVCASLQQSRRGYTDQFLKFIYYTRTC